MNASYSLSEVADLVLFLANTIFFHRWFAKFMGLRAAKTLLLGCTCHISDSLQLILSVNCELKLMKADEPGVDET